MFRMHAFHMILNTPLEEDVYIYCLSKIFQNSKHSPPDLYLKSYSQSLFFLDTRYMLCFPSYIEKRNNSDNIETTLSE